MATQLREGTIILPQVDNNGHEIESVHSFVLDCVIDAFGGVTVTEGLGCWNNPDGKLYREKVRIYTFAYAYAGDEGQISDLCDCERQNELIASIAINACRLADQECVYVRRNDGRVFFYSHR